MSPADAGALEGLSSRATETLLRSLSQALHRDHDVSLTFASAGGVEVARRVREGETADLLVLAEDAMTGLESAGRLVPGTLRPLFTSQVVLAVPSSAPVPVLDTEEDLVAVLRAARTIGYSTGPSGRALTARLEQWGLARELGERLVQAPAGVPVARMLLDRQADVGIQQYSELAGMPGVRVVGPLPGAAAVTTVFSGAVLRASHQAERAAAALGLLGSPGMEETVRSHGMGSVPA